MKKTLRFALGLGLLACAAIALSPIGSAIAQVTLPYLVSMSTTDAVQVIPKGSPSAGSKYVTALQLRNWILGNNTQFGATAPTLTACGTGSPTVVGSNVAGTITAGTSATGCVATFATAFALAPSCVVTSQTAPATTTPAYSVSASAITIVQTSTSGNKYDYVCVAQPGG